jgi:opacity protein-like surface antigen
LFMPTLTTLGLLAVLTSPAANASSPIIEAELNETSFGLSGFSEDAEKEFRHTPVRSSSRASSSRSSSRRPVHTTSRSSRSARSSRTVHTTSRRTVVHTRPVAIPASRPAPSAPPVRVVHHRPTYRVVRPYHGVFVYGPRPVHHRHYHVTHHESAPKEVKQEHLPKRTLDRTDTFAVGLRTGSYFSAYDGANGYADVGLGLTARYRPAESVGLELALSRHADDWESTAERNHTVTQGSVILFASPWSRISPYALAGVTHTDRSINDEIRQRNTDNLMTVSTNAPQYGLHGGLGVEFALGKNLAVDLEGRYVGYVNDTIPGDPSINGAFTTTAGFLVHF